MKISITKRIGTIICITMLLTLGISQFILLSHEESLKKIKIKETVQEVSRAIYESIIFSMGEGITDIQPYIERSKKIENLKELRIIPTGKIKSGGDGSFDDKEKEVATGKTAKEYFEQFRGENIFRSIQPILAEKNCISCHSANENDILAVISIRYSVQKSIDEIILQRIISILFAVGSILVALLVVIFILKQQVIKELLILVENIKRLAVGDVTVSSEVQRDDELGILADSIRSLQKSLKSHSEVAIQISRGNINSEITVLSEKDILGNSMVTMEKSLSALISDVNYLYECSKDGKLSARADANKHNGEYRKVIEAFNLTLDSISLPLIEAGDVLKELSDKNLTVRMIGEYKGDFALLRQSINQVADSIDNILKQISGTIHSASSASIQISSSTEEMAAGAQEQSAQTIEIAGAVEEMTRTILDTTKNAANAAQRSRVASESAISGTKKIEESKIGMKRIVVSSQITGKIISSLSLKTDQIGEITQVIDDIADQTNLLALNAAIEAARAGEQGRGFAVVADEVRKLAERTTKATKEIANTIRTVQSEAKEADKSMYEASESIQLGMKLTQEVADVLSNILKVSEEVVDLINQVAAASEEQSAAAEQISKNIEGISNVTSQSASGISEMARSSEDLTRLTDNLQSLITKFKIDNVPQTSVNMRSKLHVNNDRTLISQ